MVNNDKKIKHNGQADKMDGFIGTSRYENGMSLQVLFRIISRFVCMKIRTEILTQNSEMHGILAGYAILTQNVEWEHTTVDNGRPMIFT